MFAILFSEIVNYSPIQIKDIITMANQGWNMEYIAKDISQSVRAVHLPKLFFT